MAMEILTVDDLQDFKKDLLNEMRAYNREIKSILENRFIDETQSEPKQRWLKSIDVIRMLKISASTLQTLRINGTIPYSKIGNTVFYDSDDIQKVLNDRKILNS